MNRVTRIVTRETVCDAVQAVIDECAHRHGMHAPFDVVLRDAKGERAGVRVFEDRGPEPLPGMAGRLSRGRPPLTAEVTDALGESQSFDIEITAAQRH